MHRWWYGRGYGSGTQLTMALSRLNLPDSPLAPAASHPSARQHVQTVALEPFVDRGFQADSLHQRDEKSRRLLVSCGRKSSRETDSPR